MHRAPETNRPQALCCAKRHEQLPKFAVNREGELSRTAAKTTRERRHATRINQNQTSTATSRRLTAPPLLGVSSSPSMQLSRTVVGSAPLPVLSKGHVTRSLVTWPSPSMG